MDQEQSKRSQSNFFDQLMFGTSGTKNSLTDRQDDDNKHQLNQSSESTPTVANETAKEKQEQENPQFDLDQMMGQIDTVIGYVDKLKPAFNKFSPIIEMLKSFSNSNKK